MPASTRRPVGAPQVLPYLYYPDARVALEVLVAAFGFTEIEAFRDDEGVVWHAQVSTGDGVVLIGPGLAKVGTRAINADEHVTSRTFVYIDDIDAHCEVARRAGATIVTEPADQGPNRLYIARDPGGQQWIFARPLGG